MIIKAICHTCAYQHSIDFDPVIGPGAAFSDWLTKHPGPIHDVDFIWAGRTNRAMQPNGGWEQYVHNADVKVAYASSASATITLASLGASSTLLAGTQSSFVDNTTNKYLDYLLGGHYKSAATNLQAGLIRTAVVGMENDTPTWGDVFESGSGNRTVNTADIYNSICRVVGEVVTDTSQRTYPIGPVALAGFFGGVIPGKFVIFVSHNAHTSTNPWSSTEGDHGIKVTPAYATLSG